MKLVMLAAMMVTVIGCARSESGPKLDPAYVRDVDRFCNAEEQAGAAQIETTAKSMVVADWLGRVLETAEARQFLADLTSVSAAEKAVRLRAEGKRAGLADCPTAAAWERVSLKKSDAG